MIPNLKTKEKPASGVPLRGTKIKNSILRLKSAGEPSQRASQTLLFPIGGVYLKISEPISLTGSAGGIPPKPPFRPPRLEAEAKRTISSFSRAVARKENHK